jgi:hypothetical protein
MANLKKRLKAWDDTEVVAAINESDLNHDGVVTRAEFMEIMRSSAAVDALRKETMKAAVRNTPLKSKSRPPQEPVAAAAAVAAMKEVTLSEAASPSIAKKKEEKKVEVSEVVVVVVVDDGEEVTQSEAAASPSVVKKKEEEKVEVEVVVDDGAEGEVSIIAVEKVKTEEEEADVKAAVTPQS